MEKRTRFVPPGEPQPEDNRLHTEEFTLGKPRERRFEKELGPSLIVINLIFNGLDVAKNLGSKLSSRKSAGDKKHKL